MQNSAQEARRAALYEDSHSSGEVLPKPVRDPLAGSVPYQLEVLAHWAGIGQLGHRLSVSSEWVVSRV